MSKLPYYSVQVVLLQACGASSWAAEYFYHQGILQSLPVIYWKDMQTKR